MNIFKTLLNFLHITLLNVFLSKYTLAALTFP